MPERQPTDGAVSVNRPAKGMIGITASTDGQLETLRMSEFNAWRVFGMLSLFLGLPLPKAVGKAIKLSASRRSAARDHRRPRHAGEPVAREMQRRLAEQGIEMVPVDRASDAKGPVR